MKECKGDLKTDYLRFNLFITFSSFNYPFMHHNPLLKMYWLQDLIIRLDDTPELGNKIIP